MVNYINVTGLLFDISGAAILAWGLVTNTIKKIAMQVGTSWGYNAAEVQPRVEQWVDSIFGVLLLIGGFSLQVYGSFETAGVGFAKQALFILSAVLLIYLAARKWLVHLLVLRILKFLNA